MTPDKDLNARIADTIARAKMEAAHGARERAIERLRRAEKGGDTQALHRARFAARAATEAALRAEIKAGVV